MVDPGQVLERGQELSVAVPALPQPGDLVGRDLQRGEQVALVIELGAHLDPWVSETHSTRRILLG